MSGTAGSADGWPSRVIEVDVSDVYALRAEVLRRGTPSDEVRLPGDDDPNTSHLAIRDDEGTVVAISTWTLRPSPDRPDQVGIQLRGMAVSERHQRQGLGAALVDAGVELARRRGAGVVWANARDSALGFYVTNGFAVVGEGFVTPDTRLAHHRVLRPV